MEILPDKWVKPFSSGLSCINCINSECVRGVSAEKCADICDKSKRCNFGYHVQLPNEKDSYCLPLDGFPHWGNPSAFLKSMISPESIPILTPGNGVKVTTFYNPEIAAMNKMNRNYISQLGIYLLRYRLDPDQPEDDLYLMPDMTFGKDPNNAMQVVIFRDLPVSSGISVAEDTIRNGELVFIKNSETNNIFYCRDEDMFSFVPYTVRWSSSTVFYTEDLFHTQLVSEYPFYHTPILIDDLFAIRSATTPIDLWVLYWDVDPMTKKLVMARVTKEEMADFSHLDKFKKFSLERQDKIDIFQAENFVNSQIQYLMNAFFGSPSKTNQGWTFRIILITIIVFACIYACLRLFINKTR